MEIKLSESQKEALKLFKGRDEQELIRQFVNIGILFCATSQSNKKLIMEMLEP